jgi:hypothetical protein
MSWMDVSRRVAVTTISSIGASAEAADAAQAIKMALIAARNGNR